MFADGEAVLGGDLVLALLDLGIVELFDAAAIHTDQMVVMRTLVEFEDRLAGLKMMALQQARLLELGQYPIHRCQADIEAVGNQMAIHVLGGDVPWRSVVLQLVEQVEDLEARVGGLEADALEVVGMGHEARGRARGRPVSYDIVFAARLGYGRRDMALHTTTTGASHLSDPRKFPMKRTLYLLPLLAACSGTPEIANYLTPYRVDVRQGNMVTQEMVAQLKPGLSREQVRFILGSPLVADMFHADRWDYVYRFQPGRGDAQQRVLTVFFQDNKLLRVTGDVVADDPNKQEAPRPAAQVLDIPGPAPVGTDTQDKK